MGDPFLSDWWMESTWLICIFFLKNKICFSSSATFWFWFLFQIVWLWRSFGRARASHTHTHARTRIFGCERCGRRSRRRRRRRRCFLNGKETKRNTTESFVFIWLASLNDDFILTVISRPGLDHAGISNVSASTHSDVYGMIYDGQYAHQSAVWGPWWSSPHYVSNHPAATPAKVFWVFFFFFLGQAAAAVV